MRLGDIDMLITTNNARHTLNEADHADRGDVYDVFFRSH